MTRLFTLLLSALLCLSSLSVQADILTFPKGKVLLTISGNIKHTNSPGKAEFDRDMLEALGMVKYITKTYWTNGMQQFEGVPGYKLMEAVGVTKGEGKLNIKALDKYIAKVPLVDLWDHRATLALKNKGEYLTVANHGPLWLIYPLDEQQKLLKKQINSRSIWQTVSIEVL